MAENFTTYTEVDPNSHISKTSSRITWADLARNEDAYVYDDKGVAYFSGYFEHLFAIRATASQPSAQHNYWALANVIDDWKGIEDANEDACLVSHSNPSSPNQVRLYLNEIDGGTRYQSSQSPPYQVLSLNTTYYLKVVRDESVGTYGTLYLYVYSDAARTNLLSVRNIALHSSKKDFRYVYGVQTYNGATTHKSSGYTEDLTITLGATPTVTTQAVSEILAFTATGNGNVTDLGSPNPTQHGVVWSTSPNPTTADSKTEEGAVSATGAFVTNMTELLPGTLYYVRAYAINAEGTVYGGQVTFTTLAKSKSQALIIG